MVCLSLLRVAFPRVSVKVALSNLGKRNVKFFYHLISLFIDYSIIPRSKELKFPYDCSQTFLVSEISSLCVQPRRKTRFSSCFQLFSFKILQNWLNSLEINFLLFFSIISAENRARGAYISAPELILLLLALLELISARKMTISPQTNTKINTTLLISRFSRCKLVYRHRKPVRLEWAYSELNRTLFWQNTASYRCWDPFSTGISFYSAYFSYTYIRE